MRRRECDVLVTGGGSAGIAAAVAAGRAGARVVLLERYGFFGGLAAAGMVGTVCGVYHRDASDAPARFAVGGGAREWVERLAGVSGGEPFRVQDGLRVLPADAWSVKRLADEVIREITNVQPLLHATLFRLEAVDGGGFEAEGLVWNEPLRFRAATVVDATGEATAVRLAGGKVNDLSGEQAPSVVFTMQGADPTIHEPAGQMAALRAVARAAGAGALAREVGNLSLVPMPNRSEVVVKVPLARDREPNWKTMTALEMRGRELVDATSLFLIEKVPAFARARLGEAAPQIGVRLGRCGHGRATLGEDDVLACRRFPDGVARGAWPIEVWRDARAELEHLPEGGTYEIPLDCLRPEGLDGIFLAGRCISASARALGSARVIGTALSTGWAAGTAAAVQAAGKPVEDAVARLRGDLDP